MFSNEILVEINIALGGEEKKGIIIMASVKVQNLMQVSPNCLNTFVVAQKTKESPMGCHL